MDITHTHTTTDYPESYSDHTQAYSNNIDINLSSPGVDKQFALYEGSIYGPQAYAEPLNFCDSVCIFQCHLNILIIGTF